ncbi:hypothetical protein E3P99_03722 [Wallemia hederae]|uniref:Uncharacterized protein n=1 Tax=Wallemia hederae TaxID=1540922 RepID=A0A4T0FGC7_9BASI|nr:hypothetical protein E3P99_03722 [Wallemia hederae]
MLDYDEVDTLPTDTPYHDSNHLTGLEEIDFSPVQRRPSTLSTLQSKLKRNSSVRSVSSLASRVRAHRSISSIMELFKTPIAGTPADSKDKNKSFDNIPTLSFK